METREKVELPEGWQTMLDASDVPKIEAMPGVFRQTLLSGKNLMLVLYTLEKGAVFPEHNHPHEQSGYVISGLLEMIIDGKSYVLRPGGTYFAAAHQMHSARVLEDTVVLDAFSPPREDYLADPDRELFLNRLEMTPGMQYAWAHWPLSNQ